MAKVWRVGLVVLVVSVYFLLAPFGYGAFAILQLFRPVDPARRARRLQGVMRRAFTLMHDTLRFCRLLDFDPRQIEGSLPEGPVMLVANHPCLCDVTSVMASFEGVTTAVKPALYRRRWFRPLLEGARLFAGAGGPRDASSVVASGVARIEEGFRVLIFPEGTRSPEGELHRFGRTAFEIACQANVPVVPVVITCHPVWLSKEYGLFATPPETPRLRLSVLPPVLPSEHGFSSRKLRDVVEARVRNRLGLADVRPLRSSDGTDAGRISRSSSQTPHRRVADARGRQARGHRDGSTAVR